MIRTENLHFYRDIPAFEDFSGVTHDRHYHAVPEDWDVVLTDIEGSTKAIEEGRYKDVNALGAASIIAVTNAVRKVARGVELPFVFGGDGATILTPRACREEVIEALAKLGTRAEQGFSLSLRMGIVPMSVLVTHGERLLVSKHRLSEYATIAMFSGGGITFAESLLKDEETDAAQIIRITPVQGAPDLEGFECRWHPVPAQRGQIASVLVISLEPNQARFAYRQIIERIDRITQNAPHPLNTRSLELSTQRQDFRTEALLRSYIPVGILVALYQWFALCINFIGKTLLRTRRKLADFDGATYLDEVAVNTDYRKFDDTLRLTLDLGDEELRELEDFLDDLYRQGRIAYGIHVSDSAQITCMIESHNQRHLHFIDGTDGGYASASVRLKRQLETLYRRLERFSGKHASVDHARSEGSGPPPTTDRAS